MDITALIEEYLATGANASLKSMLPSMRSPYPQLGFELVHIAICSVFAVKVCSIDETFSKT
jgi:hypothetical protein